MLIGALDARPSLRPLVILTPHCIALPQRTKCCNPGINENMWRDALSVVRYRRQSSRQGRRFSAKRFITSATNWQS